MAERRSWGWIVFFVILTALCVVAITLPIVYNLGQQLRQEALDEARLRWREHGPDDYDLTFSVYIDRDRQPLRHLVLVRHGKAVFSTCEGEPVEFSPELSAALGLPLGGVGKSRGFTVPLLFDHLQNLLDEQQESEGKNFLVAVFDPTEGWPRRFVWRIRGTSRREEWNLKVWKPGELEEQAKRRRGQKSR
jgi:hypothetical protein